VWHTQTQLELELAIFAYVDRYNHDHMHEVLGDLPPNRVRDARPPMPCETPKPDQALRTKPP